MPRSGGWLQQAAPRSSSDNVVFRQVLVTQVGRQLGQQVVQVGPYAIPGGNSMDSRRMPEIVQARLIASPAAPLDAGNRTQATESSADRQSVRGVPSHLRNSKSPPSLGGQVWRLATNAFRTALSLALIGTMRILKNFVPRMWSSDRGRSTSETLRRRASPRRNPAPYRSNTKVRKVSRRSRNAGR